MPGEPMRGGQTGLDHIRFTHSSTPGQSHTIKQKRIQSDLVQARLQRLSQIVSSSQEPDRPRHRHRSIPLLHESIGIKAMRCFA